MKLSNIATLVTGKVDRDISTAATTTTTKKLVKFIE